MHNLGLASDVPLDEPRVNGIQHRGPRGKIKRHIVSNVIAWGQGNAAIEPPFFDVFVANSDAVLFLCFAIAEEAAVGNYADQIADMRYVVDRSHACMILLPMVCCLRTGEFVPLMKQGNTLRGEHKANNSREPTS